MKFEIMLVSRRQALRSTVATALCAGLPHIGRAADPLTLGAVAAFVGLALLSGVIGHVGGKAMASVLGEAQITDVRTWIREAVAELEAFVSAEFRKQLDAKVLEQMRAHLEAIRTHLVHYASIEQRKLLRNKYLLESADNITADLIPLSLNYDQAIFVSTATMAYRLFAS